MQEAERRERARMGVVAAAIMNTGMASKQDGTAWMPWDVFPELQPMEEEMDDQEEMEANAQAILNMFRGFAAMAKAADS